MLTSVADWIFGCSHRHTSFPFTLRKSMGNGGNPLRSETYVVCLDCGKRFAYDWSEMRIAKQPAEAAASSRAERGLRMRAPLPAANRLFQRRASDT